MVLNKISLHNKRPRFDFRLHQELDDYNEIYGL